MEPFTYFLAASRHAPVQAVWWGHPVSTGLPSIDYFLSLRLAEPHDAQQKHYSEELVLFEHINTAEFSAQPAIPVPESLEAETTTAGSSDEEPSMLNMSFAEEGAGSSPLPSLPPLTDESLEQYGIPSGHRIYFVFGRLFKWHPHFDRAVRSLLEQDPLALVVAIQEKQEAWTLLLWKRLRRSFLRAGTNGNSATGNSATGNSSSGSSGHDPLQHDLLSRVRMIHYWNFVAVIRASVCVLDTFPYAGTVLSLLQYST
jgi:hypothetical protein